MVVLLLTPTGVSGRGSWSLRSHLVGRTNLNLRLHGGVGHGVFVGDDQQFVESCRLIAEKSVLEEGALSAPGGEVLDGLDLMHSLAGVAELGPSREVVAGRLVGPLDAEGELARLGRPLVGAGEVADEDFREVQPTVDAVGLEAVEPCARRACLLYTSPSPRD